MRKAADGVEAEQNAILDIYAERTGGNREELEAIMKEEKMCNAELLLENGFISKINNYTTNNAMSKNKGQEVVSAADNFLTKLKNFFRPEIVNYDFTDAEGNVLFATESEDETLEVGMKATPV